MTEVDSGWREEDQDASSLSSEVWLMQGLTRSEPAELAWIDERLSLLAAGELLFHVPLADVREVRHPWFYFGGGVQFTVDRVRYRLSFVRPTADGGSVLDVPRAREEVRAWRRVLEAR